MSWGCSETWDLSSPQLCELLVKIPLCKDTKHSYLCPLTAVCPEQPWLTHLFSTSATIVFLNEMQDPVSTHTKPMTKQSLARWAYLRLKIFCTLREKKGGIKLELETCWSVDKCSIKELHPHFGTVPHYHLFIHNTTPRILCSYSLLASLQALRTGKLCTAVCSFPLSLT